MPLSILNQRSHIIAILFITLFIILFLSLIPRNAQTPTVPASSIVPSSAILEHAQLVITTSNSSTLEFLIDSEAWKEVRSELLKPENCFMGREEYCVRDPKFINDVMKEYLGRYEGYRNKVFTREELLGIAESLKVNYDRAVQSPDGLKRLEEVFKNRYKNPVIVDQGSAVGIDMGVLPSTLGVTIRRGITMSSSTHWTDSKVWKSEEWLKLFDTYMKVYPNATRIHLVVYFPYLYGQPSKWEYIFDRATRRVIVLRPDTYQGITQSDTLPEDLSIFIRGEKELNFYSDLKYTKINPGYYAFDFTQK